MTQSGTKDIEFRRHSFAKNDKDSEWQRLPQRVGKQQLSRRNFTHLFVSPHPCSDETMRIFAKNARDFPNVMPHRFQPHLLVAKKQMAVKLWKGPIKTAAEEGRDMLQAAIDDDIFTLTNVAIKAAVEFDKWVGALPRGAHALVVGQSPFLEMIIYGYHALAMPQLQPCDGFRIHVDELGVQKLITFKEAPELIAANAAQ